MRQDEKKKNEQRKEQQPNLWSVRKSKTERRKEKGGGVCLVHCCLFVVADVSWFAELLVAWQNLGFVHDTQRNSDTCLQVVAQIF